MWLTGGGREMDSCQFVRWHLTFPETRMWSHKKDKESQSHLLWTRLNFKHFISRHNFPLLPNDIESWSKNHTTHEFYLNTFIIVIRNEMDIIKINIFVVNIKTILKALNMKRHTLDMSNFMFASCFKTRFKEIVGFRTQRFQNNQFLRSMKWSMKLKNNLEL